MLDRRRFLGSAAGAGLGVTIGAPALLSATSAYSDNYPSRLIRFIHTVAPGNTADLSVRVVLNALQERLGQTIVVENRPGAANAIGAAAMLRSDPNGYTFGFAGPVLANLHLMSKTPQFNFVKEATPIIVAVDNPVVFAISAEVPAKTVPEFIAYLKANPKKVFYATPGPGSVPHFLAETFNKLAGTEMIHVPTTDGGFQSLMRNDVQLLPGVGAKGVMSMVESGRARVLAVLTEKRGQDLIVPDAPTLKENGIDLVFSNWFGFAGPTGFPKEAVAKLNQETNAVLKTPDVVSKLQTLGVLPVGGTPEEVSGRLERAEKNFAAFMAQVGLEPT